ncbi:MULTISPECIES: YeiH family protein [unclassified Campylobacter]|uniref:YeiH family protein n=1 Tax=unclassified Campylobacter TaxID=2593542 RepID=UPI003D353180
MIGQSLKHFFTYKFAWFCLIFLVSFSLLLSLFPPFSTLYISPLIISVILGMMIANLLPRQAHLLKESGILTISTKQILRLGIILFGFRINFQNITELGSNTMILAFLVVFSTFFIALFIGKFLGLSKSLSALIGSGSGICGAAAVMASSSTIKSNEQETATAICTVVLFGTTFMFVYPIIFRLNLLDFNDTFMGVFTGASLHEVAHVIAAGAAISDEAKQSAVIVKMLRVLMLVPFLILLSGIFKQTSGEKKSVFPFFALYFFIVACINSLLNLPEIFLTVLNWLCVFLLCMAMCALGFTLNKNAFKNMGLKPFILASILFIWIFCLCFLYVKFIF